MLSYPRALVLSRSSTLELWLELRLELKRNHLSLMGTPLTTKTTMMMALATLLMSNLNIQT